MEPMFSYQFQSAFTTWIIFGGLAFVGISLGFMFWLDFRKRFAKGGHVAGAIVLVAAGLLGTYFGYKATQPGYFKELTATEDGTRLEYHLFAGDEFLPWGDINGLSIQHDRFVIDAKNGDRLESPVVYRGDQARLLRSTTRLMPGGDPTN